MRTRGLRRPFSRTEIANFDKHGGPPAAAAGAAGAAAAAAAAAATAAEAARPQVSRPRKREAI